jgi:hypothetical protein
MIDNRSHRGAGASPQTKSRTGTEQSQSVILQSSLIEASIFIKGGGDGYECDSTLDRGNGENIFSRMNKRSNEGHVCQAAKERNGCEGNHFL